MTNQHTQGEWQVFIQPAPHGTVRTINVGSERVATLEQMESIEESEANAKLIANAPNMLDTLEVILRNFKLNYSQNTPVTMQELEAGINIIQHTISKATNQ
jgi:hypothetical protein